MKFERLLKIIVIKVSEKSVKYLYSLYYLKYPLDVDAQQNHGNVLGH